MPGTNSMPARSASRADSDERRRRVVIGHRHRRDPGLPARAHEFSRRVGAVGGGGVEVEIDHRDAGFGVRDQALGTGRLLLRSSAFVVRTMYSRSSRSRWRALLVGELEEDLLALRVLEPFAVPLEEPVRRALAADADLQRLPVVDALRDLVGARGEQPVGRALEEQERRPRLELRVLLPAAAGSAPRASTGGRAPRRPVSGRRAGRARSSSLCAARV